MEFWRTYPYLVANAISVAGILVVLLCLPRGPFRRSVLWSGLLCLPAVPLALLSEGSYWNPIRWGRGRLGIEDVLFVFMVGSFAWLLAAGPFRRRFEMQVDASLFIRRYLLVVTSFVAASILLWQADVRGMINSLVGGMAPLLLALGLRRDLWRVAATGLLLFLPTYIVLVKLHLFFWPDYVLQWNRSGHWAGSWFGIPIGELEWAASFAVQWPVIIGYLLGVKIRPASPRTGDAWASTPGHPSRAILRIFVALSIAAGLSCLPFLFAPAFRPWPDVNLYVQVMVGLTAVAFFYHASLTASFRNALRLFAISILVGGALEYGGIRWDFVCGSRYHYHAAALPQFPAGIPVCVLLMWFILTYTALVFLRPLAIRVNGALSSPRLVVKASLCALYLVAVDLLLDPLCTAFGLWTWENPGPYFTVPLRNFVSWFFTGLIICGTYLALERPGARRPATESARLDSAFLIVSITLTAFCGCASLLLVPSILPVVLSFACLAPFWIYRLVPRRRAAYYQSLDGVVRGGSAEGCDTRAGKGK